MRPVLISGLAAVLAVTLLGLGVFVSGVALANHNFSDVPSTDFYHNAVEWVFNRGITAGCATGLYCPNDPVTRGTMAVFLQREGQALTPQIIRGTSFSNVIPVDPDAEPLLCHISPASYTPAFPQRILARGWVNLKSGGSMSTWIRMAYSTDGGANWNDLTGDETHWPVGGQGVAGVWYQMTGFAYLDLSPGVTYTFRIRVGRADGTADATDHQCEFMGEIVNRNPTSSPLSPRR